MIDPALVSRGLASYLGLAIGDALGATVEFMTPREISHRFDEHREVIGGGWLKLAAGQVTDDTEMALALGRSIVEREVVDEHAVAEAFSSWMRGKPVDIGHTVLRGISHFRRTGEPWVQHDDENAGNGACMRCLPIALRYCLSNEASWISASRRQAHVTHNSVVADAGTEAVLRMIICALHGGSRSELTHHAMALAEQRPLYRFDKRRVDNPSGWLVETLQAVFQAMFGHDSFETTMVDVVNRGGDADTTGAIAGMLAGALYGLEAIPERWLKALNPEVSKACRAQTMELLSLAVRHAHSETGDVDAGN